MPENSQNTSEARLLSDERFLRRITYQYYEDGHSQEAIAETEFCSRQTVSKALQKANKPVQLVTLKKEDHKLSRSETRLLMLQSSIAFLKTNNPPD